jgi:hypothetical protein
MLRGVWTPRGDGVTTVGERLVDFVVVGLGLGTLGVLCGVILSGWLSGRWERAAATAASTAAAAHHRAVAIERRGAGHAMLSAGGALILATIGGLAGSLDDRTGAYLVATTATVGAFGILGWSYLHRTRHPLPPLRTAARATSRAVATAAVDPPQADAFPPPPRDLAVADQDAAAPAAPPEDEADDIAADGSSEETVAPVAADPDLAERQPTSDGRAANPIVPLVAAPLAIAANGHATDADTDGVEAPIAAVAAPATPRRAAPDPDEDLPDRG